jgi:hypothetical protein
MLGAHFSLFGDLSCDYGRSEQSNDSQNNEEHITGGRQTAISIYEHKKTPSQKNVPGDADV